jgi:hypothetical protein
MRFRYCRRTRHIANASHWAHLTIYIVITVVNVLRNALRTLINSSLLGLERGVAEVWFPSKLLTCLFIKRTVLAYSNAGYNNRGGSSVRLSAFGCPWHCRNKLICCCKKYPIWSLWRLAGIMSQLCPREKQWLQWGVTFSQVVWLIGCWLVSASHK